jgi:hypothetical protein
MPIWRAPVRTAWAKLGLRDRLAHSNRAIVVLAFAVVFAVVRAEMAHNSSVIKREEVREASEPSKAHTRAPESHPSRSHIAMPKALLLVGGADLIAALLAATYSRRQPTRRCGNSPPLPPSSTPATSPLARSVRNSA